ncbi:uncharacterized protein LOC141824093 [Curcuma longa]|uniref:uncharacterized protein LOC141824093 n=1 Tax=Curcuma longa TaxID=136217 RepID=UPI003D9F5D70
MSLSSISKMTGAGCVFAAPAPQYHSLPVCYLSLPLRASRSATHVARARKGLSRSRRLDNRNKREDGGGVATENEDSVGGDGASYLESPGAGTEGIEGFELSTTPMPVLPGEEKDFWEGPQWNAFGFFVQYLWAFGVGFALIACGIAVATYNEGATDFRQTTVYKESVQTKELLEESEASDTDVFEANPTEVAPSLE